MQQDSLQVQIPGSDGFHQPQVQCDLFRLCLKNISKNSPDFLKIITDTFKPVVFIALYGCLDKPTI